MSIAAVPPTTPRRLDILVVEDEPAIVESIHCALGDHGHRVTVASDGQQAMQRLDRQHFDVAICDLRLPKADGIEVSRRIRKEQPNSAVILMSAYAAHAEPVMKGAATHYLGMPFKLDVLINLVDRIAGERNRGVTDWPAGGLGALIGASPAIEALRRRIAAIAIGDAPVLITGESGAGKGLCARLLHDNGPRADKPFVAVQGAAFSEARLDAAQGGTLLVDEAAELPGAAQSRLLRAIEQGRARIISVTAADLPRRVEQGAFRADLLERLAALPLHVPSLRERIADFPLLVRAFYRAAGVSGGRMMRISPRAWAALRHYKFPGNVRELKQAIEQAVADANGAEIDLDHLPQEIARGAEPAAAAGSLQPLAFATKEFEREYLVRALQRCDWQRTRTATMLGISRKTLWQKLRQHGIVENESW